MTQPQKYASVDFSEAEVVQWTPDWDLPGAGFKCNRPEFVTFWKKGRIAREINASIGRCWVIVHDDALVGYITLLADKLVTIERLLASENVRYTTYPAVKIGLLAVDGRAKGAGRRLVEWALDYMVDELMPNVGVRFATVDALYDIDPPYSPEHPYDSSGFYAHLGFQFANPDEPLPPADNYRTMYYDLKTITVAMDEEEG